MLTLKCLKMAREVGYESERKIGKKSEDVGLLNSRRGLMEWALKHCPSLGKTLHGLRIGSPALRASPQTSIGKIRVLACNRRMHQVLAVGRKRQLGEEIRLELDLWRADHLVRAESWSRGHRCFKSVLGSFDIAGVR